MRTGMTLILTAALLPVLSGSAQQTSTWKQRAVDKKEQVRSKIDMDAEPVATPSDKLNVQEFALKRKDLEGKVVELEFDRVQEMKQIDIGYSARVTFESMRTAEEGVTILIPAAGGEFFEKLSKESARKNADVYVEVISANIVRALGARYNKNKPEGERYSW
jgi:hypothetical protein